MKLATADKIVERDEITSDVSFKIKASGKAFRILSDSLYTDKPRAIIRELSCNAYDAHVAAGKKDEPFLVKLPTAVDPVLVIRDYGIGLSHRDVVSIITTYFESTKTESNDFVGALGLGSKSPFSYVDSYTVTSYFNGVKRMYCAFIDSDDTPKITLLNGVKADSSENGAVVQMRDGEIKVQVDGEWWSDGEFTGEKTDEPNGLEISIPVKMTDVNTFVSTARDVFFFFETRPKTIPEISYPEYTVQVGGDNWEVVSFDNQYPPKSSPVVAIQGNVAYELNYNALPRTKMSPEAIAVIKAAVESFTYSNTRKRLLMRFNIGDLDVAASREGLSYNDLTFASLDKVATEMQKQLVTEVEKKINTAKTLWDAVVLAEEYRGNAFYGSITNYQWNGTLLPRILNFKLDKTVHIDAKVHRKSYGRKSFSEANVDRIEVAPYRSSRPIIVIRDTNDTMARARHAVSAGLHGINAYSDVYVISAADNRKLIDAITKELGGYPILMGSSLTVAPKVQRAKNTTVGNARVVNFYRNSASISSSRTQVDFEAGGVYSPLKMGRPTMSSNYEPITTTTCEIIDFVEFDDRVIVPYAADLKKYEDHPKWKDLKTALAEKINPKTIGALSKKFASVSPTAVKSETMTFASSEAVLKLSKFLPNHEIIDTLKQIKAATVGSYQYNTPLTKTIESDFKVTFPAPSIKPSDLDDMVNVLYEKYPFIKMFVQYWGSDFTTQVFVDSIKKIDELTAKV